VIIFILFLNSIEYSVQELLPNLGAGAGPRRTRDGRAPPRYPVLEVLEVLLVLGAGPRRTRDGRAPPRYPVLEVLEVLLGAGANTFEFEFVLILIFFLNSIEYSV